MSKTQQPKETYRKDGETRTRRRKIEEARVKEVHIPSKQRMEELLFEASEAPDEWVRDIERWAEV